MRRRELFKALGVAAVVAQSAPCEDKPLTCLDWRCRGRVKADGEILRWSDQSHFDDWEPREDNSAGDIGLGSPITQLRIVGNSLFVTTEREIVRVDWIGAPYYLAISKRFPAKASFEEAVIAAKGGFSIKRKDGQMIHELALNGGFSTEDVMASDWEVHPPGTNG